MKNKIPKIIFIISLLPYLFILLYGIFNAFAGISFFYSTSYGFEAFIISVFFMLYALTLEIPIIPICLIFQICYIFRKKLTNLKMLVQKNM